MKIFVKKTLSGLTPSSRSDFDKLQDAKLKLNEYYEVEIKQPRNIQHHRKLFALLNTCFDHQEYFINIDDLRSYLTMKAGYYNRVLTPQGEFFTPQSISFAKMDQTTFNDLYEKFLFQVCILLDCSNDDILEALKDY